MNKERLIAKRKKVVEQLRDMIVDAEDVSAADSIDLLLKIVSFGAGTDELYDKILELSSKIDDPAQKRDVLLELMEQLDADIDTIELQEEAEMAEQNADASVKAEDAPSEHDNNLQNQQQD